MANEVENALYEKGSPLLLRMMLEPEYEPFEHIILLSKLCRDAVMNPSASKRLIISITSRVGKTQLISQALPLWFLENFPKKRVLLASHSDKIAEINARWIRDTIELHDEKLDVSVSPSSRSVSSWMTTQGGELRAVGTETRISGVGADLLVIDDALPGWTEAHSEADTRKMWDWYVTVARLRLHPGGVVIVVGNRWSDMDLTGRLLEAAEKGEGEPFDEIRIPMVADHDPEADETDPLGREPGEYGFLDMWPQHELEARMMTSGPRAKAVHQQDPGQPDGDAFDRFKWGYWDEEELPKRGAFKAFCRFWDLAATEGGGDYTVGVLLGRHTDGRTFVLDVVRGQWGPANVKSMLAETVRRDVDEFGGRLATRFEQQPGGAGVVQADDLLKTAFKGFRAVEAVKTGGGASKEARAWPWSAAHGMEKVVLCPIRDPSHFQAFVDEHALWGPKCRHDDCVDAAAGAFNALQGIVERQRPVKYRSRASKLQTIEYRAGGLG